MTTKSAATKTTNRKTRKPNTNKSENLKARKSAKPGSPTKGVPEERSEVLGVEATRAPEKRSELLGVKATGPSRRGGGKSTGRKKAAAEAPELPPAEPGRGASRLRNSVNSLLASESDRFARMLFSKAIAGNLASARLLVELSGANKPPAEEDEECDGPSVAEWLASQPRYIDPDNLNILQLPSGEIFIRQRPEDPAALDAAPNPKLLSRAA